ncbi:hypothetical protein [Streptomyces sp. C10-9-1]|uniref:hypothetical protein n=1 Tax=Streptomyces sp. C10-9-1 TaxID=1859285 RepID=UPI003D75130A
MSNEGWERIRRPLPPDPPRGDLAAQFAALRHSVLPRDERRVDLELADTRTFGSGVTLLRYRVRR